MCPIYTTHAMKKKKEREIEHVEYVAAGFNEINNKHVRVYICRIIRKGLQKYFIRQKNGAQNDLNFCCHIFS